MSNVSQKLLHKNRKRQGQGLYESLPAIARTHTVAQPISVNITFDQVHHSSLFQKPLNFRQFPISSDIAAKGLQQWPIGQDLPAIEGHGGLRPGKCQIYKKFQDIKEFSRCKGEFTIYKCATFLRGQTI